MERKHKIRLAICGTTAVLVVAAAAINQYLTAKNDVPLPFPFGEQRGSSLAGDLTKIGKSDIAEVFKVTFPEGVDSEELAVDRFFLVYTPEDSLQGVPLDSVLSLEDGSHDVSFFGYQYSSPRAELEREHRNDELLRDRFPTPPGKFFASHKARFGDNPEVDAFAEFESGNEVVMLSTDTVEGATLEPNQLYLIIVNEPVARITVRSAGGGDEGPSLCQNGAPNGEEDPGEECDDGNDTDDDDCTNECRLYVVNPFAARVGGGVGGGDEGEGGDPTLCGNNRVDPSEECDNGEMNGTPEGRCTTECRRPQDEGPSGPVCGDGSVDEGEQCDDANPDLGDGCNDACSTEGKFRCTGAPSACVSYNAYVKTISGIKDTDDANTKARKALLLLVNIIDAQDREYDLVKNYDINNDGVIDSADSGLADEELSILAPSPQ